MIKFKKDKEDSNLLNPGYRKVKFGHYKEGHYIKPFSFNKSSSGKDYILLHIRNLSNNFNFSDNFFITEKVLFRISYLYKKLFKKPIPEDFKSIEELSEHLNNQYFKYYHEHSEHNMIISAEIKEDGFIRLKIPYKDFYNPIGFKEKDFIEKEEKFYIKYIE